MRLHERTCLLYGALILAGAMTSSLAAAGEPFGTSIPASDRLKVHVEFGEAGVWYPDDSYMLASTLMAGFFNARATTVAKDVYRRVTEKLNTDLETRLKVAFQCSSDPTVETFCNEIVVTRDPAPGKIAISAWITSTTNGFEIDASVALDDGSSYDDKRYPRIFLVSYVVPPDEQVLHTIMLDTTNPKNIAPRMLDAYWFQGSPMRAEVAVNEGFQELRRMIEIALANDVFKNPKQLSKDVFAKHERLIKLEKAGRLKVRTFAQRHAGFFYALDENHLWYWDYFNRIPDVLRMNSTTYEKPTPK